MTWHEKAVILAILASFAMALFSDRGGYDRDDVDPAAIVE
jgi:hypothetical protein